MNERIEQLAKQALDEYKATWHNEARIPEAYLEKFAELILQECKLFCGHDSEGVSAMFKHFGVEE